MLMTLDGVYGYLTIFRKRRNDREYYTCLVGRKQVPVHITIEHFCSLNYSRGASYTGHWSRKKPFSSIPKRCILPL